MPGRAVLVVMLVLSALMSMKGPAGPAPVSANDAPFVLTLEPVAGGFEAPVYLTHAGDGSNRLFVVEQAGTVQALVDGVQLNVPFLDIRALVTTEGSHQGLFSIAFHPDYATNGHAYVAFTDNDGANVVARFTVSDDPNRLDPDSMLTVLSIPDRHPQHNLNHVAFGPDGYLYVSIGDEGGTADLFGNGQNLGTLYGTVLRLDVDGAKPYAIPPDNPFVGVDGAREEIWAWGLRNPWRFSFDRATSDLFIADVGETRFEEINVQPADSPGGENYGWSEMEGFECFPIGAACDPEGKTPPVHVYSQPVGCQSVTGGYVYRGSASPIMSGAYLFGDFCAGQIWALRRDGDDWVSSDLLSGSLLITSFGEDEAGEIYVVDMYYRAVFRLVGSAENPSPAIQELSPDFAWAGTDPLVLRVIGSGFAADAVLRWNGEDRPTDFKHSGLLEMTVEGADIRFAGLAGVTVFNPGPGGGESEPAVFTIDNLGFGHGAFETTWSRTDGPVDAGAVGRTWMWGPTAFTGVLREDYAEAPDGGRMTQYFDKSRMEITQPDGDSSSPWHVTNGLLVVELITGRMQVGDAEFVARSPSLANLAGDPADLSGPTYQTFGGLLDAQPLEDGAAIAWRVDRSGVVTDDLALAAHGVTTAQRVTVPGIDHQVASPFWEFMNQQGLVWVDGEPQVAPLFENPYYATGLPVTEAYWTTVLVGGTPQEVLVQCFERRCLTYTPGNEPAWQVEAGNVGRHYYQWRYGDTGE
ncbi:MAG TPA: PQQ-dependent sugar dehydrogenase [Thermomicrobiales bacterium]|nr:PQQ-dependent sugar dehydrogenase [Thermomicrobiales bacterium]